MEIRFKDKKLRQLCEERTTQEKKLGSASAKKLRTRLGDLEAAARLGDLIAGNPHPLKGSRVGQFALDLAGGCRLVLSPANEPLPTSEHGSLQWAEVTIVCIEYIGDYHD